MATIEKLYNNASRAANSLRLANQWRSFVVNHNGHKYTAEWDTRQSVWAVKDSDGSHIGNFTAIRQKSARADIVHWLNN